MLVCVFKLFSLLPSLPVFDLHLEVAVSPVGKGKKKFKGQTHAKTQTDESVSSFHGAAYGAWSEELNRPGSNLALTDRDTPSKFLHQSGVQETPTFQGCPEG